MAQTALSQLLALTPFLFLLFQINAQTSTAPAPTAPAGPINLTGILDKAGGFTTFIRLLTETQLGSQINNQVNTSSEGMSVFAPTDNAFQNLPAGALNNLSPQRQIQLVQYHVTPKFYTLASLQTVSNPVRTQASGQDNQVYGLYFTGEANQNQVNVSSGLVETPIYNTVRKDPPLAIYQVDKVLWPSEFNQTSKAAAPPVSSSSSTPEPKVGSSNGTTAAAGPSPDKNDAKSVTVGLSLVSGLWLLCMAVLL